MDRMLCGYRDDSRLWDKPEIDEEDTDLRTETEKRLEWIEDEWKTAQELDSYEGWNDVRMMTYGAVQSMVYADGRHEERADLTTLGSLALKNGIDCIKAGKYEGAPQ